MRVDVIATGLGDDGALLAAAVADGAEGVVLVAWAAATCPRGLARLRAAVARVPVVVALGRRGARSSTGRTGSRAPSSTSARRGRSVGARSAAAARMTLAAGLAAGLDDHDLRGLFAPDDP